MDVVEVVQELTDEDVGAEVDDLEEEEKGGGGMGEVRRVMGDLIDELVSHLSRGGMRGHGYPGGAVCQNTA